MLVFKPKDPEEVLDYPVDFTDWLTSPATLDDSPVVTAALDGTSTPGGLADLTVDQIQVLSPNIILWLSGGTDGETYIIKIIGTDSNSPQRTWVRRARLRVKNK